MLRSASSMISGAVLQRFGGLEQGADLDVTLDTEQTRQPKRAEQRVAALRLGDQEADGRAAVDVLDDLGNRHQQPRGRRLFGQQRPEIDRHGRYVVQRRVDRGQAGAPARRVLRRAVQAEPQPDGVVQLARVQPDMRVSQRKAVGHQAGPGDRVIHSCALAGVLHRRLEQQFQQGWRDQRRIVTLHQQGRKTLGLCGVGGGWTGRDLRLCSGKCHLQPCGQRGTAWQASHLRVHAGELQTLHRQAQPQRVPPADIGAAVGVVADPARQDDRPRARGEPAVRPDAARRVQQRAGQGVERVAAVGDCLHRRIEFFCEGRAVWAVADEAGAVGAPARRFGQRCKHGTRQGERRMGGEHGRETRPFDALAKRAPGHRTVIGIGPDQACGERDHLLADDAGIGTADIGGKPPRPGGERVVAKMPDDRGDARQGQLALVGQPGDRQGDGEHGVAERVFAGACAGALGKLQQVVARAVEGCVIRHRRPSSSYRANGASTHFQGCHDQIRLRRP